MKGRKIKQTLISECNYDGDCKYKNLENKYNCLGCYFGQVINKTKPKIIRNSVKIGKEK